MVINGGGTAFNGVIQNFSAAPGESATVSGDITINADAAAGGHLASVGTGSTLTLNGSITSSVKVLQRTGTVIYSGGGAYTDFGITGTARLGVENGLATNATADLGVSGNGTLDLAGYSQSLVGITKNTGGSATIGNSSTTADSTLTITGTSSFAGVIQDAVGSGSRKVNLTVNGAGQTLTLTNANTYTGNTTVTNGTLKIGTGGSIASTSTIQIGSGAIYDVSAGAGNELGVNQSLTGNGTVKGAITVDGTLAIGNSPGTMTFEDGLTLGANSISNFEFTNPSFGSGTYDLAYSLLGGVSFGGTLDLVFSGGTYLDGTSVQIFDFGGTYSNDFTALTYSGLGAGQSATFDAATGTITVIPEPSAALLGGLGLLALLRRRRA